MERKHIESLFFLGLLVGTGILVVLMILPYLSMLVLAAILAFLFSGTFERLAKLFKNRSLAAAFTTIMVLVTVVVPLSLATYRIVQESASLYEYLFNQTSSNQITDILNSVQNTIGRWLPGISVEAFDLTTRLQDVLTWMIAHVGSIFAGISKLVIGFFLLLLFFFYILRDGAGLKRRLMDLSPLSDRQEEAIIEHISQAIASTLRGQVLVAILQGMVASIGFYLFSIPNPALWGSVLMLASFVPTIGTAIIQIPAVLYLFAHGDNSATLGLLIWGMTAVGLLDNFLGPKLMARGTRIHPLVMLLSILGGIGMFGPLGILFGPILVSLLYALLEIYLTLMRDKQTSTKTPRVWHRSGV